MLSIRGLLFAHEPKCLVRYTPATARSYSDGLGT
jgi:hypothetical protein